MPDLITLIDVNAVEILSTMFFTLVSVSFISKAKNYVKDNYNFRKSFTVKDAFKIELPPEVYSLQYVDTERLAISKYKEYIYEFIQTMKTAMKDENLHILYSNINSLTVYSELNKKKRKKDVDTLAAYFDKENKILLFDKDISHIFHEFIHMATTIIKEDKIFTGFRQIHGEDFDIGESLNEGYTQLFVERYFNKYYDKDCYSLETYWASEIEDIVGKEKMEELFTHANLHGLIEELEKYESRDKIIETLSKMDFYTNYVKREKQNENKERFVRSKIIEVEEFLYNCKLKKLKKRYDNNEIELFDFALEFYRIEKFSNRYSLYSQTAIECKNIIKNSSKNINSKMK